MDCPSFRVEHLEGLAASMLCSNSDYLEDFSAASISPLKLSALKATVGESPCATLNVCGNTLTRNHDLIACNDEETSNGEPPDAVDFSRSTGSST